MPAGIDHRIAVLRYAPHHILLEIDKTKGYKKAVSKNYPQVLKPVKQQVKYYDPQKRGVLRIPLQR